MKINNKGFTFIEILAVIVIIGLLTGISIAAFSRYKDNAIKGDYEALARSSYNAMEEYMMSHPYDDTVSLETLENENLLSNRKDPGSKEDCTGTVEVAKNNGSSGKLDDGTYKVHLCCVSIQKTYTYPGGKSIDLEDTSKCNYVPEEPVVPPTPGTKYTLKYNDNGGSGCSSKSITKNAGETWGSLCTPTKSGNTFKGWKRGSETITSSSIANGNITVTASWTSNTTTKYTLKYNDNGGSGCSSKSITRNKNEAWGTLCTPTRSGYKFNGWYDGNTKYTSSTKAIKNVTVKANWTSNAAPKYTCAAGKYLPKNKTKCATCIAGNYCKGGTWPKSTVDQGLTKCPTGYKNSPSGSSKIEQCYMKVSGGKYVKNKKDTTTTSCGTGTYKAEHNVNYNSTSSCTKCPTGYGNGAGTTKKENCIMNVSKNKYVKKAKDKTSTACPSGQLKDAHKVYYGKISSCSNKSIVVTFDCNGGTKSGGPTSATYKSDVAGQKFTTTCTRYGYTHGGWKRDKNGTTNNYSTNSGVSESFVLTYAPKITIYAHWSIKEFKCSAGKYLPKASETCTTCKANNYCPGGTYKYNASSDQGINKCLSNAPKYDKSPAGSDADNDCYISVPKSFYIKTAKDKNATACPTGTYKAAHNVNYGKISSCSNESIKVTFDCNGGTRSGPATSTYTTNGKSQKFTTTCSKKGYNHDGWNLPKNKNATNPDYSVASSVSENWILTNKPKITIYAHWKEIPAPTCEIVVSNNPAKTDGWYSENVSIKMNTTGTVLTKGLAKTRKSTNGLTTASITSSGKHKYYCYVKNASGESENSLNIYLDKREPTITLNVSSRNNVYNSRKVNLTIKMSDEHSGIDKYCIKVGGKCNPNKDAKEIITKDDYDLGIDDLDGTSKTIYACLTDKVGNIKCDHKTYTVYKECKNSNLQEANKTAVYYLGPHLDHSCNIDGGNGEKHKNFGYNKKSPNSKYSALSYNKPWAMYRFYDYQCYCKYDVKTRRSCGDARIEEMIEHNNGESWNKNHMTIFYQNNANGIASCKTYDNKEGKSNGYYRNFNVYVVCYESEMVEPIKTSRDSHGYTFYSDNSNDSSRVNKFKIGNWYQTHGNKDEGYDNNKTSSYDSSHPPTNEIEAACNHACKETNLDTKE